MRGLGIAALAALAVGCAPVGRGEAVTGAGMAEPAPAAVPAAVDREWAVVELGGAPVEGRAPTIAFRDGRIFGFAGCNRYFGPVSFTGREGMKIGPAAMTMMACPDAQMALEQRFARALEGVTGWQVADGVLTLTGAGGAAILRARVAPADPPAGD